MKLLFCDEHITPCHKIARIYIAFILVIFFCSHSCSVDWSSVVVSVWSDQGMEWLRLKFFWGYFLKFFEIFLLFREGKCWICTICDIFCKNTKHCMKTPNILVTLNHGASKSFSKKFLLTKKFVKNLQKIFWKYYLQLRVRHKVNIYFFYLAELAFRKYFELLIKIINSCVDIGIQKINLLCLTSY